MVGTVVLAMLLVWVRKQGSFANALMQISHSQCAWGASFLLAFSIARDLGPVVRGRGSGIAIHSLFAVVFLASLYLAWSYYRTMHDFIFGLDRDFPYSDRIINALESWFDRRRPVPSGVFKLEGEYPLVGIVCGMAVILFLSCSGFLLGLIVSRKSNGCNYRLRP